MGKTGQRPPCTCPDTDTSPSSLTRRAIDQRASAAGRRFKGGKRAGAAGPVTTLTRVKCYFARTPTAGQVGGRVGGVVGMEGLVCESGGAFGRPGSNS